MYAFLRFPLIAVLGIILLPGCALIPRSLRKKQPTQEATKTFQLVGSIVLLNEEEHFVLIDSGSHASPTVGSPAEARASDGSAVPLKVTEVRKRPFAIADIVSGQPHVGDQVFQERMKNGPTPSGAAD